MLYFGGEIKDVKASAMHWEISNIEVEDNAKALFYFKNGAKMKLFMRLALALMIGGAFGNLIDRAFYWHSIVGFSGVIDFLSFEFWGWRFATFNIADSALVVGTILLIVSLLIEDFKKEKIVKEDLSKAPQEYLDELEQKQKENE